MNIIIFFFSFCLIGLSCKKPANQSQTPAISVTGLNCSGAIPASAITAGIAYNGSFTIPYSASNGQGYGVGDAVNSSGVSGLTARLQAGSLTHSGGLLTFDVNGTAITSGTANFAVSFAGQSCTVSLAVNEPSFVQYGTPFANVPDRRDATIYQINMRVFNTQRNFQAVIARLDSIKALGINVIYLMPVFPVGAVNSVNSPYCVKDYKLVNTEFGNLTDLRNLVDGAHNRNMSVILDWVANHTSWDNAWIGSHKDWYLQNGAGTIISPPGTGWNDVAQLNFNNNDMRLEMIRSMKYWVYTANIDGYRCDYADGPPFDFWKQAVDTLRNITSHKLLLLAEGSRSNHYTAGFDYNFGFNFFSQLKTIYSNNQSVTGIDALNNSEYINASNGQQVVRYLSNHDVNGSDGTPLELFGGATGSLAAFIPVAYMKSVPMIYNGQEVGTPYRLPFPFTGTVINWTLNPAITAEYKKIIAFRNSSLAIRRGLLTSYSNADICSFTKEQGIEKVFVATNLRNNTINFTLPAAVANTTWNDAFTGNPVSLTTQISLQPYSYVVLKL
jgi:glycosidase